MAMDCRRNLTTSLSQRSSMFILQCNRSAISFRVSHRSDNGIRFAIGTSWIRLFSNDQMTTERIEVSKEADFSE
jgi:hypothetical protein